MGVLVTTLGVVPLRLPLRAPSTGRDPGAGGISHKVPSPRRPHRVSQRLIFAAAAARIFCMIVSACSSPSSPYTSPVAYAPFVELLHETLKLAIEEGFVAREPLRVGLRKGVLRSNTRCGKAHGSGLVQLAKFLETRDLRSQRVHETLPTRCIRGG